MTFDQIQRYRLTARALEAARKRSPCLVLDAGSREGFLNRFLPRDRVVNLDRRFFRSPAFIQGDILALPFPAGVFDAASACDVFEHLPPSARPRLLDELDRVSRDLVLLAAPFFDPEVAEAERLANEFCLRVSGKENEFLAEHIREGLPRLEDLLDWIDGKGYHYAVFPGCRLERWLAMICLNAYLATLPESWDLIFSVNEFYDRHFSPCDSEGPSYRRLVVIGKERLPEGVESAPPSPSPPASALAAVREIVERIDLGKDEILGKMESRLSEEIVKLTGIIDAKTARIEELGGELAGLRRELEAGRRELASRETELDAIKSTRAYRFYQAVRKLGRGKSRAPRNK